MRQWSTEHHEESMEDLALVLEDLVTANRILANEKVLELVWPRQHQAPPEEGPIFPLAGARA